MELDLAKCRNPGELQGKGTFHFVNLTGEEREETVIPTHGMSIAKFSNSAMLIFASGYKITLEGYNFHFLRPSIMDLSGFSINIQTEEYCERHLKDELQVWGFAMEKTE